MKFRVPGITVLFLVIPLMANGKIPVRKFTHTAWYICLSSIINSRSPHWPGQLVVFLGVPARKRLAIPTSMYTQLRIAKFSGSSMASSIDAWIPTKRIARHLHLGGTPLERLMPLERTAA
jgi:hypothetical protein